MPGADAVLVGTSLTQFDFTANAEGDINTADFFDTAILVSLFEEKRASASEMPIAQRRRGWIGNESTPNFERGSKLWLFEQARITQDTFNGITTAAQDGLQWLVDDEFASEIILDTVLLGGVPTLQVIISRPNSKVEKRFYSLWENSGVTNSTP